MKNAEIFIGIDIAKATFCAALLDAVVPTQTLSETFSNDTKGFNKLIRWIKKYRPQCLERCFFLMEHTGVYGNNMCLFFSQQKYWYSLVSGLEIKRSMGIRRGKTDKSDAKDIALYAFSHRHSLPTSELPEEDVLKLQQLLSERDLLIKARKMFTVSHGESLEQKGRKGGNPVIKKEIKHLVEAEKKVDKQIEELIASVEKMQNLFNLVTSVPGIGKVTAAYMLVYTRLFTRFQNSRQFASFACLAPFEHSSGTSIRGRTKVSPLGNKRMKSLFRMGALAAVKTDKQLKSYYQRKQVEGKNKALILNAVANKVLGRVFAVVNRGTPYVALAQHLK